MLSRIPCCPNHRQSDAERNAQVCPRVRRDGFEERTDLEVRRVSTAVLSRIEGFVRMRSYVEGFTTAGEEHICARCMVSKSKHAAIDAAALSSSNSQAPTIARVDPIPPTPYVYEYPILLVSRCRRRIRKNW